MMRRGRNAPSVGFAMALLSVALLIALATLLPESKEEVSGAIGATVDSPLPGGTAMSLADALTAADMPLFRPSTSVASDESISDVWVRSGERAEVLITYETGMVAIIKPDTLRVTLQQYAQQQSRDGVPGRVEQLRGVDAYVVDPGAGEPGASVTFILEGTIVTMLGQGPAPNVSVNDLITAAESTIDRSAE
jgi:hypothetical protein